MSGFHTIGFYICIVIIISLLYLLRNFILYYVDPYDYETIFYDNLRVQTGDLLFCRGFNSPHNFMTANKFSHVGIIIIIKKIPYFIEISYPAVTLTTLDDQLKTTDGRAYYIKQLKRPLNAAQLNAAADLIMRSKNMIYDTKLAKTYVVDMFSTLEDSCKRVDKYSVATCGIYIIWFLRGLGLIETKNVKTSAHLDYLNSLNDVYQETKLIKYKNGAILMRPSDYPKLFLEQLTTHADPRASSTALLNIYLR